MESEAGFFSRLTSYKWMCSFNIFLFRPHFSLTYHGLLSYWLAPKWSVGYFHLNHHPRHGFFAKESMLLAHAMTRWSFVHDVTRPFMGSSLCTESANCKSCFPPFDRRTCNYDEFIISCPTRKANSLHPRIKRETKVAWNLYKKQSRIHSQSHFPWSVRDFLTLNWWCRLAGPQQSVL